ncbi:unnamed protein product [Rotaria magnacalcarata]
MSATSSPTYEQIYLKAKNGFTGDATVWDQIFQYIRLHPNELFYISPNRAWSIGHQIVYHVLYGDVRKLSDYVLRSYQFQFQLKNADDKTPLALAQEQRLDELVEEIQSLIPSDDRESATMNDEREDDRSVFVDSPPTIDNRKSSVPTTVQRVTPQLLKNLTCMLTKQIFVDPVKASDGKTYERNAIIGWLRENRVSPQTGEFIDDILVDDIPTKNLIIQLRQQNLLP